MASDLQNDIPARDVYQAHLDKMTRASLAGDYDTFSDGLRYPWRMKTLNKVLMTPDKAAGRADFFGFLDALTADGVTDLIRLVETADYVSPTEITGTHISHRMRGANRILGPYHNRLRLIHDDIHGWRETDCANAILNKGNDTNLYDTNAGPTDAPDLDTDPERTPE